jgi:hypothetical protein
MYFAFSDCGQHPVLGFKWCFVCFRNLVAEYPRAIRPAKRCLRRSGGQLRLVAVFAKPLSVASSRVMKNAALLPSYGISGIFGINFLCM